MKRTPLVPDCDTGRLSSVAEIVCVTDHEHPLGKVSCLMMVKETTPVYSENTKLKTGQNPKKKKIFITTKIDICGDVGSEVIESPSFCHMII